jgi:hypothetical protein
MSKDLETYQVEVRIRKKGGLTPIDSDGNKVTDIKLEKTINPLFLDTMLKRIHKDFEAITSEGSDINIEAYLPNSISNTWMNMASYYGSEERFVKH